MTKPRDETFFGDLQPLEREQFLEDLFIDLRSPKTDLSAQIWRTAAVVFAALLSCSLISPTLTIPVLVVTGLAASSLLLLIPVIIYRLKLKSLRHALVDATSTDLGLPRASQQVDVWQEIQKLAERGQVSSSEIAQETLKDIAVTAEEELLRHKLEKQGVIEGQIQASVKRSKESRGIEKRGSE